QNSSNSSYKVYIDEQFQMDFSLQLPPTNFIQDIKHFYKSNLAPALNFAFDPLMNKTNLVINAATLNLDETYLFDFEFQDNTNFSESITAGFKVESFNLSVFETDQKNQQNTDIVKQRVGNTYLLNKIFKVGDNIDLKVIINEPGDLQTWKYSFKAQTNLDKQNMPTLAIGQAKKNVSNFQWIPKTAGTFLFQVTFDDGYSIIKRNVEVKVAPDTEVELVISPEPENDSLIHFIDEPKIELSVGAKDGFPSYKYSFGSNPFHTGMILKDGKFIFSPNVNDVRDYTITLKVEDSLGTRDERKIDLVVSDIALQFDPLPNKSGNTYALSLGETIDIKVLFSSKNITKIEFLPGTLPGGQFPWNSFSSVLSINTNDIGVGNHTMQFKIFDEINQIYRVYDLYLEIDEHGSYEAHNGLVLRHDEVSIMEPGSVPLIPKATNNKIKWYDTVQLMGSDQFLNNHDSITGDYALCNIYNISELNVSNIEEKVTKTKMKMEAVVFTKKLTNDLMGASFLQSKCRNVLKKYKKYSGTYSSMLVGCHTDQDNINFECSKEEPPE
ncbi:hypothetical protein N9N67_09920, partial [Bacteriovoracaceae bacterium]|nr:hypothetical protein [Bacteriovoracaceae bacterium]